jgi:hypothetical protein
MLMKTGAALSLLFLTAIQVGCTQSPPPRATAESGTRPLLPAAWTVTPGVGAPPTPRPATPVASTPTVSSIAVQVKRPNTQEVRQIQSIWDYGDVYAGLDLKEPGSKEFRIRVASDEALIWPFYWCASDKAQLELNLQSIAVQFSVDGRRIPPGFLLEYETDSEQWNCHYWATLLSRWRSGSTISLTIQYSFGQDVFDGYSDYPAGDYYSTLVITVTDG